MRLAKRFLVVVTALFVGFAAASGVRADDKKFGDGTDGLKAFWDDIIKSAQAGDEKAVTAALEGAAMTDDEFKAVFADAATATAIAAKYKSAHGKGWGKSAQGLISKVKGDGLDTCVAFDVTADKKEQKAENGRIVPLLKPGVKMYSVRLTKGGNDKDAKAQARVDSLFFLNGKWVCGWKLASLLPKPAAAAKPAGDGKTPKPPEPEPKPPEGGAKPPEGGTKPPEADKPADPAKPGDDKGLGSLGE